MKTGIKMTEDRMMRKYLFLAAALLALAGCTSRLETDIPETNMTLIARTESSAASRTVVEGETHVYWEPGDNITVFSGAQRGNFRADISEPSDTAPFRGYLADGVGTDLWALFPASWEASYENEVITTLLPCNQEAREGSFGRATNIAIAHSTTGALQFYNVGGGVRFSVQEEGIRKVVFQGLDGEVLAGEIRIGFEDGRPAVLDVKNGKRSIVLRAPYPGTFQKDTWYYFVAIPGALEKGFEMHFFKENGHGSRAFEKSVTVKRSIYGTLTHADDGVSYADFSDGSVGFKDDQVKTILVNSFDLDNNGRISLSEAAVVRSFLSNKAPTRADDGRVSLFAGTGITSFDEMVHFTGLTRIEDGAFAGCTELTSVTLPESITSIGDIAFNGCTGLESITVMSPTPPEIGTDAFANTGDCPICVPEEAVEQYVSLWDEYAPRIQAVEFDYPVPEAVDLGLPSGVKWASWNLGASKPEEYGYYFAWGETEPKTVFNESNYKWYESEGESVGLTKYCMYSEAGFEGFRDEKMMLDPEDDAARVNLGEDWRMPTAGDWDELARLCSFDWVSLDGVSCVKLTGPNGNSIILPPGGGATDADFQEIGESGLFWSSAGVHIEADEVGAWIFGFYEDMDKEDEGFPYPDRCLLTSPNGPRPYGLTIRPVSGPEPVLAESVSLDKTEIDIQYGETVILNASILPENTTHKELLWITDDDNVVTVSAKGEVTGIRVGEATVYALVMDGCIMAQCTVRVGMPEVVDLGLPSGIKWGSFNLGSSYPYGDYYAWGETSPHYKAGGAQSDSPEWETGYDANGEFIRDYSWRSYRFVEDYQEYSSGYSFDLSKYSDDGGRWSEGDCKTYLDPEDDAAHALLGGDWRMPSWAEMNELKNYCTWEWTTQEGVNGYQVTSPANGNSIFLPAADARYGTSLDDPGIYGYYWTASRWPTDRSAVGMSFDADKVSVGGFARYYGFSIRPVQGTVPIPVEDVSLNIYEDSILIGESVTLVATVYPSNATFPDLSWTYSYGWYGGGGTGSTVSLKREGDGVVVTGLAAGTATIRVISQDGGKMAICNLSIVDPVDILVEDLVGSYTCSSSKEASEQPWTIEVVKDKDDSHKVWFYNLFAWSAWSSDDTVFYGTVDETNGTVTIPYGQQSEYLYQGETPITLFWLDTESNYDVTGSNTVTIRKDDSGKVIGLVFDETLGFVGMVGDLGYIGYAYPAITAVKEGESVSAAPRRQGKSLPPNSLGGSLLERPD